MSIEPRRPRRARQQWMSGAYSDYPTCHILFPTYPEGLYGLVEEEAGAVAEKRDGKAKHGQRGDSPTKAVRKKGARFPVPGSLIQ